MAEVHVSGGREDDDDDSDEKRGNRRHGDPGDGVEERCFDAKLHGRILEPVHGREEVRDQLQVDGGVGLSLVYGRLLRVRRPRLRLVRHQREPLRDVQLRRRRRSAVAGKYFGRGVGAVGEAGKLEQRRELVNAGRTSFG